MGLLKELGLRLHPPTLEDPDFGRLQYMYIPRDPSLSYWEGEWVFPPTGTKVAISLPGSVDGPIESGRQFYLSLPARFEDILRSVRPALEGVFGRWLERTMDPDIWREVTLAGFSVDDPDAVPTAWDVSFETTGEKWLGITIPFMGDDPHEAIVDT